MDQLGIHIVQASGATTRTTGGTRSTSATTAAALCFSDIDQRREQRDDQHAL